MDEIKEEEIKEETPAEEIVPEGEEVV